MTYITLDSNRFPATLLAALTAMLGLMPLAILPLFVGAMIDDLGLSGEIAGGLTSINLLGNALGVLAVSFISRLSPKQMVYLGIAFEVVFELCSMMFESTITLFLFRALAGIGGGLVTGAAYGWIARQANPDKGFGLLILLQFLIGSILFYYLPDISSQYGIATFYSLFILSAFVSLLCSFILGQAPSAIDKRLSRTQSTTTKSFSEKKVIANVLIAIALFELAASGIWAFIERMGLAWDLSFNDIGISLSVGSLAGIPGAALVIVFCLRWGRAIPLALGFAVAIVSLGLFIFAPHNLWIYSIALIIFNGAWSYVIPYIQGIQAQIDDTGRVAVWGMFVVLSSIAAGPFVFGTLIGDEGYQGALIFAALLLLLSFGFIIAIARRLDRHPISATAPADIAH